MSKNSSLTANLSKSKKKRSKGKKKEKYSSLPVPEPNPGFEEESVDELLDRLVLQNEEVASTSDAATVPGILMILLQLNCLQYVEPNLLEKMIMNWLARHMFSFQTNLWSQCCFVVISKD